MRNKSVIILIIVALSLGFLPGASCARSSSGSSLITQDWTYAAIEDLVDNQGISEIYVPPELNRNQAALLVARLLQHLNGEDHLESRSFGLSKNVYLDDMIFSYNQRVGSDKALTSEQVELLYRLVLEFHEELGILGYSIQDFNLLQSYTWLKQLDGIFTREPLVYSEQALAAARKAEAASFSESKGKTQEEVEQELDAIGPRNLWTGQFTQSSRYLPPANSILMQETEEPELKQVFHIGGLEVSGAMRSNFPEAHGKDAEEGEAAAGYGISVKLGELALQTAVDLDVDPSLVPKAASTSVDLSLDWADLFTLSAGYRQRELLKNPSEEGEEPEPIVTSLGLMVPINKGQLHLGMTQEWGKNPHGEGTGEDEGELDEDSSVLKNIAELGLSYDFDNDSSLHFNYRLIDFSNVEQDNAKSKAEAKFSIKF